MNSANDKPKTRGKRSVRDMAMVGGPALLVLIAGFWIAFQFVEPAPPKSITIASGGKGGAYYAFAGHYRELLAKAKVDLVVRETSGSIDNLRLLKNRSNDVQIALVQGGTGNPSAMPGLMSLASLYYEPVWVFHRGPRSIMRLTELQGLRVAVGAEGSGARAVAVQLLADNDLGGKITRSPLGGSEAAQALIDGQIDAAFFVASPEAKFVRRLLAADGIQIMSFERATAYSKHHLYMSTVKLPMGAIDLARNLPRNDVVLLAPTAALVARDDLHPALIELLLRSAGEVHQDGGLFENPGEFPSAKHLDFPINDDAKRYLESGPSFLQKFLPFWIANFLDRTKVMLLPLITLLIPLFRILPPTYRWRMQSKIIRCYRDLSELEQDMLERDEGSDLARFMAELERIEDVVSNMHMPPGYLNALYALRLHIDVVRAKLSRVT